MITFCSGVELIGNYLQIGCYRVARLRLCLSRQLLLDLSCVTGVRLGLYVTTVSNC